MRILNPHNLPEVLVRAVTGDYDRTPKENRMSVTDLINPPMMRHFKLKHWDELVENVDDLAWSLFGKAFHDLMDRYAPDPAQSEYKLEYYVEPYTLVGQPDVHSGGVLDDYKVTSCYSFILGDQKSWENQLNVYAWLLGKHNIPINRIRIIAILRDWQKQKAIQPDYPNSPFHVVEVPLWTEERAAEYIKERIRMHQELLECTPEDKWQKETTWAVVKPGAHRATRVLETKEQAIEFINKSTPATHRDALYIEERPGEKSRCKFYCPARKVCVYNKEEVKEDGESS